MQACMHVRAEKQPICAQAPKAQSLTQQLMGAQQNTASNAHGVSTQFFVDPSFFDWAQRHSAVPEAAVQYARSHPALATVAVLSAVLFTCILVRRAIINWRQREKERVESTAALAVLRQRVLDRSQARSPSTSSAVPAQEQGARQARRARVGFVASFTVGILAIGYACRHGIPTQLGGVLGWAHDHAADGPSPLDSFSHYEALRLDGPTGNLAMSALRKAYRTQSLRYHPDKNRGRKTQAEFLRVTEAFEVLSDESKRAEHDAELARLAALGAAERAAEERRQREERARFFSNVSPEEDGWSWAGIAPRWLSQSHLAQAIASQLHTAFTLLLGPLWGTPSTERSQTVMLCELLGARLQALQQRASGTAGASTSDSDRAEHNRELARLGALLHSCQTQAQHEEMRAAYMAPTSVSWARRLWLAAARLLAVMLLVVLLHSYVLSYAWSGASAALLSLPFVSRLFRQREAARSDRFDRSLSSARERMQARQQQQQPLRDAERLGRIREARRRQQLNT